MEKMAAVFPVLDGKDASEPARVIREQTDDYRESRQRLGINLERAYEQLTPMGRIVVAYVESESPFPQVMGRLIQSELSIDREFLSAIKDVHGFDPVQSTPGNPPELLADWVDTEVSERRNGLAFCAPVRSGATEAGRAFAEEAYENRRSELTASRRGAGLTRELVMLNHTPAGEFICVYIEGDDPVEGNRRFAESQSAYDIWFKDECKRIFPPQVDFNQPLPPITEIFDSTQLLTAS
jgi:hypothetical protein